MLRVRALTKYLKVFQFEPRNSQVCEAQAKYTLHSLKETKQPNLGVSSALCFVFSMQCRLTNLIKR
jgi:hypothetical protein